MKTLVFAGNTTGDVKKFTSKSSGKEFISFTVACKGNKKGVVDYIQVKTSAVGLMPYIGKGAKVSGTSTEFETVAYLAKDGTPKAMLSAWANNALELQQSGENAPVATQNNATAPQYAPAQPQYATAPQAQPVAPQAQPVAPQGQVPQQFAGTPVDDDDIPF